MLAHQRAAMSGSSRGRNVVAASMTSTSVPSRANACASSRPDGARAEHEQVARLLAELEDGLVGQVRARRRGRRSPGSSGRLPVQTTTCVGREAFIADLQRARVDERRSTATDHDPRRLEVRCVLVARDLHR